MMEFIEDLLCVHCSDNLSFVGHLIFMNAALNLIISLVVLNVCFPPTLINSKKWSHNNSLLITNKNLENYSLDVWIQAQRIVFTSMLRLVRKVNVTQIYGCKLLILFSKKSSFSGHYQQFPRKINRIRSCILTVTNTSFML